MKYRPEIDGLRALAILAVIIFHFRLPVRGGFLGVDVFFVISGYLISNILIKEASASKKISFSNFYLKRAKRILPALLFMLAATAPFSLTSLPPNVLSDYGKSLIGATLSFSNIVFYQTANYWDITAQLKPLLHTWSLGVEEQFYLIFPFFIYLIFIKFKLTPKNIFLTFLSSFFFSLTLCFILHSKSSFTFYMLPTRAWELLAGTLIAFLRPKNNLKSGIFLNLTEIIGLGLILIPIALIIRTNTVGFYNVSAVAGSALLLYCGNGVISKILSLKPIRFIGNISYSLYLWHWPIYVLSKSSLQMPTNLSFTKNIILTFLIAVISFYFVEQPFRKKTIQWNIVAKIASPLILILIFAGSWACSHTNYNYKVLQYVTNASLYPIDFNLDEVKNNKTFVLNNATNQKVSFFVWGDSHLQAALPALIKASVKHNVKGLALPCYLLFASPDYQTETGNFEIKRKLALQVFEQIKQKKIKNLLLIYRWNNWSFQKGFSSTLNIETPEGKDHAQPPQTFNKAFKESLQQWLKSGINVWILEQVPCQPYKSYELALQSKITGSPVEFHKKRNQNLRNLVAQINDPNLHLLKTEYLFEENGKFVFVKGDKIIYYDDDHLNCYGADILAPALEPFFNSL